MKEYRFLLLLLIFTISSTSYSQSNFKFGVEISGIQNFYHSTNNQGSPGIFRSDELNRIGSLGFNLRVAYSIDNDTKLLVSPGVRYLKGLAYMDISVHKGTFLDLPIQLNVSISSDWFIIAGLRFSYITKLERAEMFIVDPSRDTDILKNTTKRLFYLPKFGVGATFFKTVDLELTYNYSFSNLVKIDIPSGSSSLPSTYKNHFLQFSIIYNDIGSIFGKK